MASKLNTTNTAAASLEEIQFTDGLSLDQALALAENESMTDILGLGDTDYVKE